MQPLALLRAGRSRRAAAAGVWAAALRGWAGGASTAAAAAGDACCSTSGRGLDQQLHQQLRGVSGFTATSPTKLSEIMHVDQLADKTPDEIEQIWLQFHEDPKQRRIADVMSADEFRQLQARARASPLFVLPVAKPGGFLTLLLNWQGPVALLTSVEEYRRFGGGAPPHMTVTHYDELAGSKGLVLLRGDVINDNVVSLAEGRTLLQLVRAFYTDPSAHRLVYTFNHEPEKFDFNALLAQLGHSPEGAAAGGAGGGSGAGGNGGSSGGGGAAAEP